MRSGVCSGFTSVLVAPEDYLGPRPDRFGFDRIVTYELICTQLHWKATASNRVAVKDAVLTCAIGKSRLGYVPSKYDSVNAFWHVYWELCMQIAPELEMHEPGPKPPGAGFVQFFPAGLPREATLLHHKLPHGNLDLQFSGLGATMSALRALRALSGWQCLNSTRRAYSPSRSTRPAGGSRPRNACCGGIGRLAEGNIPQEYAIHHE